MTLEVKGGEVTNGELFRSINLLRADIVNLKTDMVSKAELEAVKERLAVIESWRTWVSRLIAAPILASVMALLLQLKP